MHLGSWSRNVILSYNPLFIPVHTKVQFLLVVSRCVFSYVWKLVTAYTAVY